ncbi:histone-lysine N-methyltransferase SETMAR [Plakobranchus ocellatus]|uniref:Histone-lysine N-methyltransferase SETMAR n=1 Tax=Plakobranchus ocellatus TaxID=259542 RepID=A0AAV4DCC4_9GAST|nr:histone-lysine N-methyltransferase SETMAR [Plakobranchus ocellatus]
MAGIDVTIFTAHSTRAASTSKALKAGVPLTTIMSVAGWSQSSTFARFYKKDVKDNFGSSLTLGRALGGSNSKTLKDPSDPSTYRPIALMSWRANDDFAIYADGKHLQHLERTIQLRIKNVQKWVSENGFKFSVSKTTCTTEPTFHPDGHPIPVKDGEYKFIMVYQDHLTKFVVLRTLKTKRAEKVAYKLVDIVTLLGAPKVLQSDNGRKFTMCTLDRFKEAIRRKRPGLLRRGVVLQQDNATPHSANLTQQWLQRYGWEILNHPAHSPDLAPSDFHLFGPLKRHLGGMAFETEDDLMSELRNWFDNLDVDFFRVGINSLLSR